MTEASLTTSLFVQIKLLMSGAVVLKHADRMRTGDPDFSVAWRRRMTSWEVKFYDDKPFEAPERQRITCLQLAETNHCRYIIYERRRDVLRTLIVHPAYLDQWWKTPTANGVSGFEHGWVARHIRHIHEVLS